MPQNTRGKLISLATEADRTLYFDFLPINIGSINGFAAKFQLYTVPGQVYYNATRRLVLRGVDGVVFVADAQADKHDDNMESLSNLKENLEEYGYDVNELPIVIQYNKSDLPTALSQEDMDAKLNIHNWPSHTAAAVDGVGVFDTLKAIMKLVLEKAKKGGTSSKGSTKPAPKPATVESQSSAALESSPVAAQSIQQVATPTHEPLLAASHGAAPSQGEVTHTEAGVAAVSSGETPGAKSPGGSGGGGLFGAPRASSGRARHSSIGSGPVAAPIAQVGNQESNAVAEPNAPESTGRVGVTDAVQDSEAQTGPVEVSSNTESMDSVRELSAEKQEATNQPSMVGHDPLEQAPPKPKQKKPGFFRRLFGRK